MYMTKILALKFTVYAHSIQANIVCISHSKSDTSIIIYSTCINRTFNCSSEVDPFSNFMETSYLESLKFTFYDTLERIN